MPRRRGAGAKSNRDYVTPHTDAALEHALADPAIDLVPWAWFSLGWHSHTLRVWVSFASSILTDDQGSSFFRSIPASVYYIRSALTVLGDQVPVRVREHVTSLCELLVRDNDALARGRGASAARPEAPFESGTTVAAGLRSIVSDMGETAWVNRHWLEFGRRLGAWYTFEQFDNRPLADSLTAVIETCREMPRSTKTSAPPIAEVVRLAAQPGLHAGQLARELCRLFDASESPVEELDETLVPVRLLVAVFAFASRVHASLLCNRMTPRWVKSLNQGTLSFRGRPVRVIPDLAKSVNIVPILDSFEEAGLPHYETTME